MKQKLCQAARSVRYSNTASTDLLQSEQSTRVHQQLQPATNQQKLSKSQKKLLQQGSTLSAKTKQKFRKQLLLKQKQHRAPKIQTLKITAILKQEHRPKNKVHKLLYRLQALNRQQLLQTQALNLHLLKQLRLKPVQQLTQQAALFRHLFKKQLKNPLNRLKLANKTALRQGLSQHSKQEWLLLKASMEKPQQILRNKPAKVKNPVKKKKKLQKTVLIQTTVNQLLMKTKKKAKTSKKKTKIKTKQAKMLKKKAKT